MTGIQQFETDLFSAGQPSVEDLAEAAAKGIRTVINLRGAEEPVAFDERNEVQKLGLRYITVPIAGGQQLQRTTIETFASELELARREGPVLIHCGSGNRVGAAIALKRGWIDGCSAQDALATGRSAGLTELEPTVVDLLGSTQVAP
jgi:uncharacterized protein (TIGR01244 family)